MLTENIFSVHQRADIGHFRKMLAGGNNSLNVFYKKAKFECELMSK